MQETDFILMSLVIFVPALFALVIPFFPKGKDDAVRWWTLFGTALTLRISLCIFVRYYHAVDDANRFSTNRDAAISLAERSERAAALGAESRSMDWVARAPWIPQFNIEYFLGLDGISLALILMTTALSFLAMIASWN